MSEQKQETPEERKAREFKEKLDYWRSSKAGTPVILPSSFRAARG